VIFDRVLAPARVAAIRGALLPHRRDGELPFDARCVRDSVELLFEALRLERLYCEPNAFNTAPNRTLQKAGFKCLKTHRTVSGPLNYHQAVTRCVVERPR